LAPSGPPAPAGEPSAPVEPYVAAPRANTPYVDGISDQSVTGWDGGFAASYFARLFASRWVRSGHIRLARFVVQWDVMAPGYDAMRATFEGWLRDVAAIGLVPDVALTSYDGVYPPTASSYRAALQALLARAAALGDPVSYLEAWNEPNDQGRRSPAEAARLTNAASAACAAGYGCAVVAGDVQDSPGAGAYERAYARRLDPVPAIWGVHPYYSVEAMSEAPYRAVVANMPRAGAGEQVWITEVGARRCHDYGGRLVENGEAGQAARARWLVDDLIRNRRPAHVFYYELLLRERWQPGCPAQSEDSALYVPVGDPNAPDAPRAAASVVLGGGEAAASCVSACELEAETARTGDVFAWPERSVEAFTAER
jgi:hypothetical protein